MANRILQNPIIAAVIDDLGGNIADADDLQRYLDFFRAQIGVNSATYADAAAQLEQARRTLAEALFAAAAGLAPPESEEQQKTQLLAVMPESEAPKPEEEELEEVVAAVAADS